jgi:lipoprotein-anchoring transpeptidase ErfK/SrfK
VKRAALAAVLLALGVAGTAAAYALADSPPPTTSTGTTATAPTGTVPPSATAPVPRKTPKAPARPRPARPAVVARIASGVTIDGVHVGGLAYGPAYSAISVTFRSPLVLELGTRTITVSPWKLGAKPFIRPAVVRALQAHSGGAVKMLVDVKRADVAAYVDHLASLYDRKVVDARLVLRHLRPAVVPDREGSTLSRAQATTAIVQALQRNDRRPVVLTAKATEPKVTADSFGPVIVIRRGSNWLYLYRHVGTAGTVAFVRRFRVATGQAAYPTPLGSFKIIVMERDPWWYPPDSPWAQGESPVPPGPGNPLGTRWMGISAPGVGIHGTPDSASIGYSASHGCIRMFIPSAEWLFAHVQVGTPVYVVPA